MKLFFFDIDGTLAIGKDVPESNKKAIQLLRDKGYKVFICTGRAHAYVQKYFKDYADGFICSNGRFAIMDNQVLFDHPMTQEEIEEVLKVVKEKNATVAFFEQEHGYTYGLDKHIEDITRIWFPGYIVKGLKDPLKPYNFDLVYDSEAHRKELEEALGTHYLLNPHTPHPSADVTIEGVDKGTALKAIAKSLNVDIKDTYAFGDGINDIVMFEAAGNAIAMGNGVKEAKAAADYITTDIHDEGVMNALKYYKIV